jgi:hypothetical protein
LLGIIFGFIYVGIGFFFLAGSYYACLDYTRVQKYSGRASGQVTKKYSLIASDGSGNYYLDYSFVSSAGSTINASSSIAKQQWDALHVGDTLEIRYDLSDHNHSIPMYGGSPSLIFAFFIFVLGGVFLVFGASRLMRNFKRQN